MTQAHNRADRYRRYQDQLLQVIRRNFFGHNFAPYARIYRNNPRHAYINTYKLAGSPAIPYDCRQGNPLEHYRRIYQDEPLLLVAENGINALSSCSQPSFILSLLSWLDIASGNRVLEVGAGSGWLMAMMADLVGTTGMVYGIEYGAQLVQHCRDCLAAEHKMNTSVIEGDGTLGLDPGAQFDRIIMTTAVREVPYPLFEQLKPGGLLLIPLSIHRVGADIALFRKRGQRLYALKSTAGLFVPVQGRYSEEDELFYLQGNYCEAPLTEAFTDDHHYFAANFLTHTLGVRLYLSLAYPHWLTAMHLGHKGELLSADNFAWGFVDKQNGMLAGISRKGFLIRGFPGLQHYFHNALKQWQAQNRPDLCDYQLILDFCNIQQHPYPAVSDCWLVSHTHYYALWHLRAAQDPVLAS